MTSTNNDPILVVVQLTGANDAMNTVIPYGDPLYYDNRPTVGIPQDRVLPIDDHFGFRLEFFWYGYWYWKLSIQNKFQ